MKKKICILICATLMVALVGCKGGNKDGLSTQNVSKDLKEADELYDDEEYSEALEIYLEAMEKNPKDMSARLGAVRCEIALEEYPMANTNLSIAMQIDPYDVDLYETYIELSKATDDLGYALRAVQTADYYKVDEFLEDVPKTPELSAGSGDYDTKLTVEIESDEDEGEIFYNLSSSLLHFDSAPYVSPIVIMENANLSAFVVVDGIPSLPVEAAYNVTYAGTPVTFSDPIMQRVVECNLLDDGKNADQILDIDCYALTSLNSHDMYSYCEDYDEYSALKIHSLVDLQYMPNLKSLYLADQNEIRDWEILKNCAYLNDLSVRGCGLTNLDFLEGKEYLKYLEASENEISNFDGLKDSVHMDSIYMYDNQSLDVDALIDAFPEISSMEFDSNRLRDYTKLSTLENLRYLDLNGVFGVDYAALGQLTNLESLYVTQNYDLDPDEAEIADLSFLDTMTGLHRLTLYRVNDSAQLTHLYGLTNLEYLYLYSSDVGEDEASMNALRQALPNCTINN